MSSRPPRHAGVSVASDSRRQHQCGEAIEQVQWRQGLRATASGIRFRAVVAEALVMELRLAISKQGLAQRDALVLDVLREASIPVAIAMVGG